MRAAPESDLLSRLIRNRPETLARIAIISWFVTGIVAAAFVRTRAWAMFWPLMILPIGLTMVASMALVQRDPERAGMDAFRLGMLAMIPSALLVGCAVLRRFEQPMTGHVATACMAGAAVGSVLGALCGPIVGWLVRGIFRSVWGLIPRSSR
ncbi:hypothetical protein [Tautonia marina]|uniref:hypothetical protein n=1 Tax=Tautonia marina TaxID=2653855 RepID=UPI001260485C|nr:hypothetical protein [Tautonia marina]